MILFLSPVDSLALLEEESCDLHGPPDPPAFRDAEGMSCQTFLCQGLSLCFKAFVKVALLTSKLS